jgi:hypothetical protein
MWYPRHSVAGLVADPCGCIGNDCVLSIHWFVRLCDAALPGVVAPNIRRRRPGPCRSGSRARSSSESERALRSSVGGFAGPLWYAEGGKRSTVGRVGRLLGYAEQREQSRRLHRRVVQPLLPQPQPRAARLSHRSTARYTAVQQARPCAALIGHHTTDASRS